MKIETIVKKHLEHYHPKNGLGHTAKFYLILLEIKHSPVKGHSERVALLSEATAKRLRKDKKAAFFGGLFHDLGKLLLPANLFDGHEINDEEYSIIKEHALAGFTALKKIHPFTALCAGLHHSLYQKGYGLTITDFPKNWRPATIKKVLEISTIISICDFIDAYQNRNTKIKDGSVKVVRNLKEMLIAKYPGDQLIIENALEQTKLLKL